MISDICKRILCLTAALLIVVHSLFSLGYPSQFATDSEDGHRQTELKQNDFSFNSGVQANSRVLISSLLYLFVSQTFSLLDVPAIRYHNCRAFLTNAYTYSIYYTHTTALAP